MLLICISMLVLASAPLFLLLSPPAAARQPQRIDADSRTAPEPDVSPAYGIEASTHG